MLFARVSWRRKSPAGEKNGARKSDFSSPHSSRRRQDTCANNTKGVFYWDQPFLVGLVG